jgi:hypothetical protein
MSETMILQRCAWALSSQQYIDYHDKEWGVPVHDDRKLFEMLILEGVQAGLSWSLILKNIFSLPKFDETSYNFYTDISYTGIERYIAMLQLMNAIYRIGSLI